MITKENEAMLKLLSDVLHGRIPSEILETEWPQMLTELIKQSVYVLPAPYIPALQLSPQARQEYLVKVLTSVSTYNSLMTDQTEIIKVLDKAGVHTVVIKGATAAVNYPKPEHRCMGDIDLLVPQHEFAKAYEALTTSGYETKRTLDDFKRHISFKTKRNNTMELHYYFSDSSNGEGNSELDKMLFNAIPNRVVTRIEKYTFPTLPIIENGLVILEHINRHLALGIGLRQIIDWMCYAEKNLDDDTWNNSFSLAAEKIGMQRLAIVITAMCQKYLGLTSDIHWCRYEPICDELMEYILSHGNFGKKIKRADRQLTHFLRIFRNPIYGIKKAQEYGLTSWKACKKHPCLKPFAWAYQLGDWAKQGLNKGISIKEVRKANTSVDSQAEFFKKLGVTKI